MQPNLKKAVGYYRVSTKEQVEEGNSLSTQEKICKEWARKNNYEIVEQFIEQGESAKTVNRTELKKLFTYCANKKNHVEAVIIYKLDRISRNTDDYSQIRLLLKKYEVEIKSTTEFFENTPVGRFMENTMANISQFDNDIRSERSGGGMREAVRDGRYVWMAPIGYINTKVNGKATIAQDPLMASLVRETFELILKGVRTVEEVRVIMEERGLALKSGKPIGKSYFYKVFKNKLYMGHIEKFKECHKGLFEPIVSEDVFNQVQRILSGKGRKEVQYKKDNEDFPLRRFVVDTENKKITGSFSKGRNGTLYPFYRFGGAGSNYNRDKFEEQYQTYVDKFCFTEEQKEKLASKIREHFGVAVESEKKGTKKLSSRITELQRQQTSLIEKNLKGIISDEILTRHLKLIEEELIGAKLNLTNAEQITFDVDKAISIISPFLKTPSEVWEMAKIDNKLKLQWFQFPSGVSFDGEIFGTTKIASIYNVKSAFLQTDSTVVDPSGIEPLASGVQNRRSTI